MEAKNGQITIFIDELRVKVHFRTYTIVPKLPLV